MDSRSPVNPAHFALGLAFCSPIENSYYRALLCILESMGPMGPMGPMAGGDGDEATVGALDALIACSGLDADRLLLAALAQE